MKRSKQLKKAWRLAGKGSLMTWAREKAETRETASFVRIPDLAAEWLKAKAAA